MAKYKRKNSEKRKEKSRDAARSRRSNETQIFYQLAKQLPLPATTSTQMDKASIMRLAITHLRLRTLFGHGKVKATKEKNKTDSNVSCQHLKALEGFVIVLALNGDILYVSDNTSKYLGLAQLELIGQSIYEFTHPCDHDEIRDVIAEKSSATDTRNQTARTVFMRLKCTLTSNGKNINLKSANYKVIKCSGHLTSSKHLADVMADINDPLALPVPIGADQGCLVGVCEPIPHPSNIEVPLDSKTFLTRHTMSMKFTYCDDRISELLGYQCDDLINKSVFDYHHTQDTESLDKAFRNLFSKGQTATGRYRFLAHGGGYAWIETHGTVIYNNKTEKPQGVVCVNYVISGIEDAGVVLSEGQLAESRTLLEPEIVVDRMSPPNGMVFSTKAMFKEAPEPVIPYQDEYIDMSRLAPSAGTGLMPLKEGDVQSLFPSSTIPTSPPLLEQPPKAVEVSPYMTDIQRSPKATVKDDKLVKQRTEHFKSTSGKISNTELSPEEFCTRAPYISTDDSLFSQLPVSLVDERQPERIMLGTTESMFAPRPDPETQPKVISSNAMLREIAEHRGPIMEHGDIARNAGPPKMKRAMEINRLETGPPAKMMCHEGSVMVNSHAEEGHDMPDGILSCKAVSFVGPRPKEATKSNILQNLLTLGEDVQHGYSILDTIFSTSSPSSAASSIDSPPPLVHQSPGSSPTTSITSEYSTTTQYTHLSVSTTNTEGYSSQDPSSVSPATINQQTLRQLISPRYDSEDASCSASDMMDSPYMYSPNKRKTGWHLGSSNDCEEIPLAYNSNINTTAIPTTTSGNDCSMKLTCSEVEVNAPVSRNQSLLMGLDLLIALENSPATPAVNSFMSN